MKISIFGLGYVGAVSLACMAKQGHQVIGVDIDEHKLELIRQGRAPIVEEGIAELFAEVAACGQVTVTSDIQAAVDGSEVSFVCVGTPSAENGDQDLAAIRRVVEQIAMAIKEKEPFHTVVIRSTIQPGTTDQIIRPIMEEASGKQAGKGFALCFQPEFLREGSSIKDFNHPPFTVIGTDSELAVNRLRKLFGDLPAAFIATDIEVAEMVKYSCNAFHALKISFANEIGRVCQALTIDPHAVMEIVCHDKQLNISKAYLKPGFSFGGSCLPKDLKALNYMAKKHDVEIPTLAALLPSNRIHTEQALDWIYKKRCKKVGMIGLSFKSGTDDLRESPLVTLAEQMLGKGISVQVYDPEVQIARLTGANKRYMEETVPHLSSMLVDDLEAMIKNNEGIILGLNDETLIDTTLEHLAIGQWLLDLVGVEKRAAVKGSYRGACWV